MSFITLQLIYGVQNQNSGCLWDKGCQEIGMMEFFLVMIIFNILTGALVTHIRLSKINCALVPPNQQAICSKTPSVYQKPWVVQNFLCTMFFPTHVYLFI